MIKIVYHLFSFVNFGKVRVLFYKCSSNNTAHHDIVSATIITHRTDRSSILTVLSLLGLSTKCLQLIRMWLRSHTYDCAIHTVFALPVAPQMFCCHGGSLSRAHSVGHPPCTPRQCGATPGPFLWAYVLFLEAASQCSCHCVTQASACLHRRGWDVAMKRSRDYRWLFTG